MITEGHLARHYQGRHGGRDPALLDVAQDYALKILASEGVFDLGLTFKGGTALRKYRAGNLGRFSTDLDFAAVEPGLGELVLDVLDEAELHGVRFQVEVLTPGKRGELRIDTPLGSPNIGAKIEITERSPWLHADILEPIAFPVQRSYEFQPASVPVMALEETLSEKLAAYRRRALVRDLYDLAWFSQSGTLNEPLTRTMTYLKIYIDVVEEGIATGPFDPSADLFGRRPADFTPEDIGLLTGEPDIGGWLELVRSRFRFLETATPDERRWARCDHRDRYTVSQAIVGLT